MDSECWDGASLSGRLKLVDDGRPCFSRVESGRSAPDTVPATAVVILGNRASLRYCRSSGRRCVDESRRGGEEEAPSLVLEVERDYSKLVPMTDASACLQHSTAQRNAVST